ncbi:polysaccharide deacetylase family protein [Gordonia sp. X0973]|uniref:polysaccharide deacetylase family protein n=1 Tax=Gordonia sp. X0973 TaxID=2742602 RepID=UPI000F51B318|nr:polysaccharide deacetylase family protein [Gordonia sp. X0973]QKT08760.1 polysaccharide deacetylase family protein [Gordonia sp. X0973]
MDRREFLAGLAVAGAGVLSACTTVSTPTPTSSARSGPALSGPLAGPLPHKVPLPDKTITRLPGLGNSFALTVDDGASSEVVRAYAAFARETGARFTFFVTGKYDSWRDNRDVLAPLVESGQIQLGNHTWTHPDLTSLAPQEVAQELQRNKEFLRNTFGVDGTPFYRPPYGFHNDEVDRVAADLGYTVPTLWYGSLSDSGVVTEQFLISAIRHYFLPQAIVIGHANHDPVTHVYQHFVNAIRDRHLQMVTLDDYFANPAPTPQRKRW